MLLLVASTLLTMVVFAASGDTIVYVTRSGEKYHKRNCQYLSKSCIEIMLADAVDSGYTRCSKCNPPKLTVDAPKEEVQPPGYTQEELDAAVKEAVVQAELDAEIYLNQVVEDMQQRHTKDIVFIVVCLLILFASIVYLIKIKVIPL